MITPKPNCCWFLEARNRRLSWITQSANRSLLVGQCEICSLFILLVSLYIFMSYLTIGKVFFCLFHIQPYCSKIYIHSRSYKLCPHNHVPTRLCNPNECPLDHLILWISLFCILCLYGDHWHVIVVTRLVHKVMFLSTENYVWVLSHPPLWHLPSIAQWNGFKCLEITFWSNNTFFCPYDYEGAS